MVIACVKQSPAHLQQLLKTKIVSGRNGQDGVPAPAPVQVGKKRAIEVSSKLRVGRANIVMLWPKRKYLRATPHHVVRLALMELGMNGRIGKAAQQNVAVELLGAGERERKRQITVASPLLAKTPRAKLATLSLVIKRLIALLETGVCGLLALAHARVSNIAIARSLSMARVMVCGASVP